MIGKLNLSKKSGGGSADVINGIIEQYLAESDTIDAGTFVEFVNHFSDHNIIDTIDSFSLNPSAIEIDTNKVFIAHNSPSSSGIKLLGVICTISDNNITVGTDTILDNDSSTGLSTSAVKLSSTKVIIAYRTDSASTSVTSYVYAVACNINGITITVGTRLTINSSSNFRYANIRISLIDTNKVFIAYANGTNFYNSLSTVVCSISGSKLSKGTLTTFTDISANSSATLSLETIDTNKVLLIYTNGGSEHEMAGKICTISGTTITQGTNTIINSTNGSASLSTSLAKIDTDKVFIAHPSDNTNYYLNGQVCRISGTSIENVIDTILVNEQGASYWSTHIIKLDTNKVFIIHRSNSTTKCLNGIVCLVSGTTITTGSDTILSNVMNSYDPSSITLIDTNKVFIAHPSDHTNYYLNGIIANVQNMDIITDENAKTIKPSENKIDGLTKTSATTSSAGDVWVLDNE